jgi:PAS domain S-box-containing protein
MSSPTIAPGSAVAYARDPRMASLATASAPAWLWATDGSRVLWCNAAGAATLGAASPLALAERRMSTDHPLAAQVVRLAGTLPHAGSSRLERLRGIGGGVGRPVVCACSRLSLDNGAPAILIAATEPAGPALPLTARVERLLAGVAAPLAVFAPDGALIHATAAGRERLGPAAALSDLGAVALARSARDGGHAAGDSAAGPIAIDRLGSGAALVLALSFLGRAERKEPAAEAGPALPPAELVADAAPPAAAAPGNEAGGGACETRGGEGESPAREPVKPLAGEPKPAAGEPKAATGEPKAAAGEPKTAPGEPKTTAGAAMASATGPPAPGSPVAAAGEPKTAAETVAPAAAQAPPVTGSRAARPPLRFVWQSDADGRLVIADGPFLAVAGPATSGVNGRSLGEIAEALGLDPEGRIARAMASRQTFSGIHLSWPCAGQGAERLPVELAGLPVFDDTRAFAGYRGFGLCRERPRLAAAAPAAAPAVAPEPPPAPVAPEPPAAEAPAGALEPAKAADARPLLTVVPAAKNVVPFRAAVAVPNGEKRLSPIERTAFREIAKVLGARLEGDDESQAGLEPARTTVGAAATPDLPPWLAAGELAVAGRPRDPDDGESGRIPSVLAPAVAAPGAIPAGFELIDLLPVGVLIFRASGLIHASRALLQWTGYPDLAAIAAAGGIEHLLGEDGMAAIDAGQEAALSLAIATVRGARLPVEARLSPFSLGGESALALTMLPAGGEERTRSGELALRAAEAEARELRSILDTATDGVIVIARDGRVLALNRSAEALFGCESVELAGRPFTELLAPESHRPALDYLEKLTRNGLASVLNDGREVIGRVRHGGLIPLFMTIGRIGDGREKLCAVLRDITQWKRAEEELLNAKRQAERASSAKSDFLAKISHEIRTPLNAVIGFAEVMMEERFGAMGNERYREYLKDIHASGEHMVSLLNDLLDLSKIEAGKLDLTFTSVRLNELVHQCVALMQPQANRERIIIRTSLSPTLPPVVVDARSIRQIVLNLLSNSIKFTGPGGQVIVSSALTERGEAVLRVRDTGVGMSDKELVTAMEPFRQLATSTRWGSGGTGLGLPLTKALAEANRASFSIKSAVNAGTLVEITFPATRVLAE